MNAPFCAATRKLLFFAAAAALAAVPAAASRAQEWTRFRGPNGEGVAPDIPLPSTWTEDDYLWKIRLPGEGHGSPVVWGERVFLISGDPARGDRLLLCVDARTGTLVWRRTFPAPTHHLHKFNSFASSTPAVDAERVYVARGTPEQVVLAAFSHAGEPLWERDLGPFVSMHGWGASPVLFDDLVILNNQQQGEQLDPGQAPGASFVIAVDRATGETRWRTERRSTVAAYSTPCVWRDAEGRPQLVFCTSNLGIDALDPATGRPLWSIAAFDKRTVGSPLVAGDLIFGACGSGGGGNYVVAVRPPQRPGQQPELVYRFDRQAPYVPTPVAHGDLVFLWSDRGVVACLERTSGEVLWQERLGGGYFASPIRVGDRLYNVDTDGVCVVLAASRAFEVLGRNPLGELTHATPAVSGRRMYLRTLSHLMALEAAP